MSFALSCEIYLDIARPLAGAFLWLAFAAAILETAVTLWAKWKAIKAGKTAEPKTVADPDAWTKFLEALAKLLQTLNGLPAWIAIFLAGFALLWISGQQPKNCVMPDNSPGPAAASNAH